MALRLPISVYRFDQRTKQYVFQSCVQFTVRGAPMPGVLTSSASQGMMGENMDLLKAVMCAPAVVLCNGTQTRIYNSSFEEVHSLPPTEPIRIIHAYELPYLNLSTQITHYRLRSDGALVLVDTGRIQCTMCPIPDRMDLVYMRKHLKSRRETMRKLLRDRRILVEVGDRMSVYSCETLELGKRI